MLPRQKLMSSSSIVRPVTPKVAVTSHPSNRTPLQLSNLPNVTAWNTGQVIYI